MTKTISMLATATLLSSAIAEEHSVSEGLFEKKVSLTGIAKPINAVEVSIAPKVWGDFIIEDLVPHGTKVAKGDRLFWINTEKCDDYLTEQVEVRKLDAIKLAAAKKELAELEVSTKRGLAQAKQNFDREQDDYKHYLEEVIPQEQISYDLDLESSSWSLDAAQEELRQLLKMYEEDGLTEETEEIIIHRHKNSVKVAEYRKLVAESKAKRGLKVGFDRKKADRKRTNEQAAINFEYTKRTLKKALEEKRIAVKQLELAEAKKAKSHAEAIADRKAMEMLSPSDGYVYYGSFKGNTWKRDIANKFLNVGSKLPANKGLVTIVPVKPELEISAYVDSTVARSLAKGEVGQLRVNAEPFKRFDSKVKFIADVPNVQDAWEVKLSSELPKNVELLAGEGVKVSFWGYRNEKALTVPVAALTEEPNGDFSVELKMAEGENKTQVVTLGKSENGTVEVLSGLEAGQVIQYGDE